MEPTISGNDIVTGNEPEEVKNETSEKPASGKEKPEETESGKQSEPVTNNYTYETYEIDNSEVCDILNQLLAETEKNNEVLESIAYSLDEIKEVLTAEPEEITSEDALPEEQDETENCKDELLELLEGMEETFTGIKETSESIYDTVSGNSLYLEDMNSNMQEYTESYAESMEIQRYTSTYGLALGLVILFVVGIIAGLNISKLVWGKMR